MKHFKILFFACAVALTSAFFAGCRGVSVPAESLPSNAAGTPEVFFVRDGETFRAAYPQTLPARLLLRSWESSLSHAGSETDAEFSGNLVFAAGTLQAGFTETQTFFCIENEGSTLVSVRDAVEEDRFFREFLAGLPFVPAEPVPAEAQ